MKQLLKLKFKCHMITGYSQLQLLLNKMKGKLHLSINISPQNSITMRHLCRIHEVMLVTIIQDTKIIYFTGR